MNDEREEEELVEIIEEFPEEEIIEEEIIPEDIVDTNVSDMYIENIPQNNIKNQTSRQRVDNAIENIGTDVLSDVGVPEPIAKAAVKSNGGTFSPTNLPGAKAITNKAKDGISKDDAAVKALESLSSKKNNVPKTPTNSSNENKKEDSNNKGTAMSGLPEKDNDPAADPEKKSALNDVAPWGDAKNKKDFIKENASKAVKAAADIYAGNKVDGAIEIAKIAVNYVKKFWKKYAIMFLAGFFGIILIFFAIMSPIIENLDKYKAFLEGTLETAEKTNNLYSGLGLKTTDEAFYDELDEQFNLANGQVDLPLVMSALLYTETTNDYSTDYADTGKEKSALEKFKEILQQYAGASEYTQGQILRARMLCKAMTEYTEGEKVTFGEFVVQYGDLLKQNIENLKDPTWAAILTASNPFTVAVEQFKAIFNAISGPTFATASGEQMNALAELFETVLMGRKSITSISFGFEDDGSPQIYVVMQTKKYSEDSFKAFLSGYYIKRMPEFKPLIDGLTGVALDNEIDRIIKEIYDHRDWYKDIYGDIEGSSEGYEETCVGGIAPELVSELSLPVKITSSSVTFSGEYAYGITTAMIHNGVDLNSSTTGTKDGDDVYAIAAGEVVKISKKVSCNTSSDANCDSKGSWIKLKHNIMVDGTKYEFYSVYQNLQANSTKLKKGSKVKKGDVIGKAGQTGSATTPQVHFEFHNEKDTPIDPTNLFITCTTGELAGSNNEEKIWFYFRNLGYSEVATAAAIGNFCVESGLDPMTVQGDYLQSNPDKYNQDYTNKVDSGAVSKEDFIKRGPGGGGYGLIQWTYHVRKKNLYEYMKKEKTSIGDLQMQLGYLTVEMNDNSYWMSTSYKSQWKNSSKVSELDSATTAFMKGFENPGTPHLRKRKSHAKEVYNRNKGKKAPSTSSVSTTGPTTGTTNAKGLSNSEKIKIVFPNGVPKTEAELKKYLVDVKVPITTKDGKKTTTTVTVHKAIAGDVKAALEAAQKEGFAVYEIGGYRKFGSDSAGKVSDVGLVYSQHCYGLAVDMNVNENCYKKPANGSCSVGKLYDTNNKYSIKKNGALYNSFISNGWGWGGEWNSLRDYMHFSFFGV